jgi:hypothetical protein
MQDDLFWGLFFELPATKAGEYEMWEAIETSES